jgi:uncharacterized membrane protein
MGTNHTKRFIWTFIVISVVLTATVSVFAFSFGKYEKVKANGSAVSLPMDKVSDGKVHFYRIEDGGKEIAFFVVKAADGSWRTAFDACDVCFHEKKGYEQSGDAVICKNCNKRFAINRIGPHETGGCNPSYLPSKQINGNIVINVSDLRTGAKFF